MMTVSSQVLPRSRAGSLALIAGDLALNFANSESGCGFPSWQDHLQQPEHVADWLEHVGALEAAEAAALRARLAADPALGRALLEDAHRLRGDIHAIGAAIAHRLSPPTQALDRLAAHHARWMAAARLAPDEAQGGRARWRWRVADDPLAAALGPTALAGVALVTERDPARIKECGGVACGWLFYDESKNNRRRWCEMEICGNRAKQRRHAARTRNA
jgi:predicted RNA-binding Zn ribbon-like protein